MGTALFILWCVAISGTCVTVNALKGKWWMAILFSVSWFPLIGIITAIRVAKPGSHWDRKWSTPAERAVADARFVQRGKRGRDLLTEEA
jgi:hypothetical protein